MTVPRPLEQYGFRRVFPTRWNDNDQYGHVNNVVYYAAMDTTINAWLLGVAGMDPLDGEVLGLCVASSCEYHRSIAYPDDMELGLAAARVGRTSVTWSLGIFGSADGAALATGSFTHVFVDRGTRRPVPVPAPLRALVEEQLLLDPAVPPGTAAGSER
ncbi:acyl-CoA thioesterase [Modestobacter muralis]|uniref:Acyl-CoA thioesterase n=1 Tax=Modestobacter muralis TaxID=1608614 RepID=A0A6P0HAG0_9ACTN|nr:thioesterase family protein [Modestobacter muralis]NEK95265.1 acyl-CoA thioesterase [Modestobacter muralis]NEN52153.1 acyl-CoA thioesterase [Modestobacter muralis]